MLENMQKPVRTNNKCKVGKIADGLSDSDRKLFLEYVADICWIAEALSVALRERGVEISPNVIRLHRVKGCACFRVADA